MELAFEKTKALIFYGPRKRDTVKFKIRNIEIRPSKKLKYILGGNFGQQGDVWDSRIRRGSLLPSWVN